MKDADKGKSLEKTQIESFRLDLSSLVGREITLYSEQFPGKPLKTKILAASTGSITIGRSGSAGQVDDLVTSQGLFVQFDYRGQRVSVRGALKRTGSGNCLLELDDKVVPLARRRFSRLDIDTRVNLAVLPITTFNPSKLDRLRWVATDTRNISGGGTALEYTGFLENGTNLFINLDVEEIPFPSLLLGQVRHCHRRERGHLHIGVEFLVKEMREKFFSVSTIQRLPSVVFQYTARTRADLNEKVTALIQSKDSSR